MTSIVQIRKQERRERVKRLCEKGLSARQIGERLQVSHKTVSADMKAMRVGRSEK